MITIILLKLLSQYILYCIKLYIIATIIIHQNSWRNELLLIFYCFVYSLILNIQILLCTATKNYETLKICYSNVLVLSFRFSINYHLLFIC